MRKINIQEIEKYLAKAPENTTVYLGSDSQKFKKRGKWFAEYIVVLVVHIASKHGCKLFYEKTVEPDFEPDKRKPRVRLMNEVYKVTELYQKLEYALMDFNVEIHLDINSDPKHNSNIVVSEALGYVKAMCDIEAKVKPEAFAASIAADKILT